MRHNAFARSPSLNTPSMVRLLLWSVWRGKTKFYSVITARTSHKHFKSTALNTLLEAAKDCTGRVWYDDLRYPCNDATDHAAFKVFTEHTPAHTIRWVPSHRRQTPTLQRSDIPRKRVNFLHSPSLIASHHITSHHTGVPSCIEVYNKERATIHNNP
mmetsp:Transcript_5659/g.15961  ORF Transcript_5659/g.15961 Transcript_5659/m.15961 type:complete len:157 (-) Transcript_5659:57-527(-)